MASVENRGSKDRMSSHPLVGTLGASNKRNLRLGAWILRSFFGFKTAKANEPRSIEFTRRRRRVIAILIGAATLPSSEAVVQQLQKEQKEDREVGSESFFVGCTNQTPGFCMCFVFKTMCFFCDSSGPCA